VNKKVNATSVPTASIYDVSEESLQRNHRKKGCQVDGREAKGQRKEPGVIYTLRVVRWDGNMYNESDQEERIG